MMRYRLLHTAVHIVDHARGRTLRVPETWPWVYGFAEAFQLVLAMP